MLKMHLHTVWSYYGFSSGVVEDSRGWSAYYPLLSLACGDNKHLYIGDSRSITLTSRGCRHETLQLSAQILRMAHRKVHQCLSTDNLLLSADSSVLIAY